MLFAVQTVAQSSQGPDAIVLIQPAGEATLVAITYSRAVPHADARAAASRLARGLGGEVLAQAVDDVPTSVRTNGAGRAEKQTGVQLTLRGASFQRDGAFMLAPIIQAMRPSRCIEVLFMVPPIAGFQGLTEYVSGGLTARLMQSGSPYRYAVERQTADTPVPELPLYQPRRAGQQSRPTPEAAPGGSFVWVLVIALGVGAAVYVAKVRRGDRS